MAFLKELEFFFLQKKHSLYRKSKSQIFPEFLVDDFNPKKNKTNLQRQKWLQVTGLGLIQNFSGCPERDTSCRGCHSGPRSCHQSVETSTTTQEPEGPLGASNLIKSEQYCSLSFSHLSHWIYRPQL